MITWLISCKKGSNFGNTFWCYRFQVFFVSTKFYLRWPYLCNNIPLDILISHHVLWWKTLSKVGIIKDDTVYNVHIRLFTALDYSCFFVHSFHIFSKYDQSVEYADFELCNGVPLSSVLGMILNSILELKEYGLFFIVTLLTPLWHRLVLSVRLPWIVQTSNNHYFIISFLITYSCAQIIYIT